jgi:hypothetical protein
MSVLRLLLISFIATEPLVALAATMPAAVREACRPDAIRLCSAVITNQEARQACMRKHRAQWSDACTKAVAEMRSARMRSHR